MPGYLPAVYFGFKINIMRQKIAAFPLIFLFVWAGMTSCESQGSGIGDNWVEGSIRTIIIDTCTVQLSTVLLDSVPTSSGDQILFGINRSELYGETRLLPYLTFDVASGFTYEEDPENKPRIRFDSLTLMLPYETLYSGDTLRRMTMNIHRLTERVEANDDNELYGYYHFNYEQTPLASVSFNPKPTSGRTLEVRLPDALGEAFLDKLQNKHEDMDNDDYFQKYFNGMVLVPGDDCQTQISFAGNSSDSLCWMRLYYHISREEKDEYELDFALNKSLLFQQVDIDRTGTPFENLSSKNNEIASSETGNMALIQGITGSYAKIEFPHLNKIRELGDHGYVISAYLIIHPLKGSYNGVAHAAPLADSVLMYVSNETNTTTNAITNQNDEIQTGSLTYHDEFQENTYYTYDITAFIADQLGKTGINKLNLQMIGDKYGYSLKNLVIGNQNTGDYNVQLEITYSIYNE